MITRVIFVGRATAEATPGWQDWALISISEPDNNKKPRILPGWNSVLKLEFHDITAPSEGKLLMSESHANEIIEFVRRLPPEVNGVMVHCRAGIRRSAAVAKWIAREYRLPFSLDYQVFNQHVFDMLCEQEATPAYPPDDGPLTRDDIRRIQDEAQSQLPTGKVLSERTLITIDRGRERLNRESATYSATIEVKFGDQFLVFSEELWSALRRDGWRSGDEVEWIQRNDGSWILQNLELTKQS